MRFGPKEKGIKEKEKTARSISQPYIRIKRPISLTSFKNLNLPDSNQ